MQAITKNLDKCDIIYELCTHDTGNEANGAECRRLSFVEDCSFRVLKK